MIVLDTHVWIWFNQGDSRLPPEVRVRAAECALSVVSVWELVLLVQKGRLASGHAASETPKVWLAKYPFKILPLDYESAVLSRTLDFRHEDPADRFIAATAFRNGAELATNDARLRELPWLKIVQPAQLPDLG